MYGRPYIHPYVTQHLGIGSSAFPDFLHEDRGSQSKKSDLSVLSYEKFGFPDIWARRF